MDSEIQLGSREGITLWETGLLVCSMDNLEEPEETSLIRAGFDLESNRTKAQKGSAGVKVWEPGECRANDFK